jgi:hypothetical protein
MTDHDDKLGHARLFEREERAFEQGNAADAGERLWGALHAIGKAAATSGRKDNGLRVPAIGRRIRLGALISDRLYSRITGGGRGPHRLKQDLDFFFNLIVVSSFFIGINGKSRAAG